MSKAEETTLNYNFEDDVKGKKKKRNKKDHNYVTYRRPSACAAQAQHHA